MRLASVIASSVLVACAGASPPAPAIALAPAPASASASASASATATATATASATASATAPATASATPRDACLATLGPADPPAVAVYSACPAGASGTECRFRAARALYDMKRLDLAAARFLDVAREPPPWGAAAADFALDALNRLAMAEPPRPSCREVMADEVPALAKVHCAPTAAKKDQGLCENLERLGFELERHRVERAAREAMDAADKPALAKVGEAYRALFDAHCMPVAKRSSRIPCDELLYNAWVTFRAGGEAARAEAVRRTFLDPKTGLGTSPLAKQIAAP